MKINKKDIKKKIKESKLIIKELNKDKKINGMKYFQGDVPILIEQGKIQAYKGLMEDSA